MPDAPAKQRAKALFTSACAYALANQLDKMEHSLKLAIQIAPGARLAAKDDIDFDGVRETPEFRRAVNEPPPTQHQTK